MAANRTRYDPYKNFKFRMLGVALVGLAALVIAKKASSVRPDANASRRNAYWRFFGLD